MYKCVAPGDGLLVTLSDPPQMKARTGTMGRGRLLNSREFKVTPLKRTYYPDFFKRTWHNCQPCIEHSKTAIKRWVLVLVFALRAHNSECFFPSCAQNVQNLNNCQKFLSSEKTMNLT